MAGVPCVWQLEAYFFHFVRRVLSVPVYSVWRAGSKGEPMWFTSTWTFPGDGQLVIVNEAGWLWLSGKSTG